MGTHFLIKRKKHSSILFETISTHLFWNLLMESWLAAVLCNCLVEALHHCLGRNIVKIAISFADGNFLLDVRGKERERHPAVRVLCSIAGYCFLNVAFCCCFLVVASCLLVLWQMDDPRLTKPQEWTAFHVRQPCEQLFLWYDPLRPKFENTVGEAQLLTS